MSNSNSTIASSGGIGFCGFLALLFITLKLLGITAVASWSWLWVLSPLWLPLAIALGIFVVIGLIYLIVAAFRQSGK